MSDERPFSSVEVSDYPDGDTLTYLRIGNLASVTEETLDRGAMDLLADNINEAHAAAVEAREAKLRGALNMLVRAGREYAEAADLVLNEAASTIHQHDSYGAMHRFNRERVKTNDFLAALDAAEEPGEYVPKSQFDEATETIAKMKAAFAALDPREYANGALVVAWLEANRLVAPRPPSELSDGDLSSQLNALTSEAHRRNWASASPSWARPHGYRPQWRKPGEPVPMVDTCVCGMPRDATVHAGY